MFSPLIDPPLLGIITLYVNKDIHMCVLERIYFKCQWSRISGFLYFVMDVYYFIIIKKGLEIVSNHKWVKYFYKMAF